MIFLAELAFKSDRLLERKADVLIVNGKENDDKMNFDFETGAAGSFCAGET